nr:BPTI/Kunitz domain-containing protein-like [Anolis sagrei ordinatus]
MTLARAGFPSASQARTPPDPQIKMGLPSQLWLSFLCFLDQSYLYRCTLPKRNGRCRGSFPRFYFNFESKKCEKFLYGGCGGNKNNFLTQDECFSKCEDQSYLYRCTLPKITGPCRAAFSRFYFNLKSKKCEEFLYGGCRGNENNFLTQQECFEKCEGVPLKPDDGTDFNFEFVEQ